MNDFVRFLLKKTYGGEAIECPERFIKEAFERTVEDVHYHYRDIPAEKIAAGIRRNGDELPVFLFRLASGVYEKDPSRQTLLDAAAWLLKECCGCDLYYSNKIDTGFYVGHGVGTVIGSRNVIGKGFQIFQGCTIGHRVDFEKGCEIGNNVILFANSAVIGPVKIGDGAVIGMNCMVTEDVPANTTCYGHTVVKTGPRTRPLPA